MLRNLWNGYRKKGVTVLCCLLLLTVAILYASVLGELSIQIDAAEVLPASAEYVGVIVPNFSRVKGGQYVNFQNGGYKQFSLVNAVEVRKLAAAYSEGLSPVHVLQRSEEELVSTAPDMPTDFFIGTLVCDEILYEEFIEGSPNRIDKKIYHTYRYGYRCHLDEAVSIFSEDAALDSITVEIKLYHEDLPTPPMRVGGTYLVWGTLTAYEDGSAVLEVNPYTAPSQGLFITEKNGYHWRMESATHSGFVVPFLSEIHGPLSEFWKTESGQQWMEDIIPKGEIQQHSVKLVGISRMDYVLSFNRGTSYIVEGVAPEDAAGVNGCLISDDLAEKNGLSLGDGLPLSVYENNKHDMYDRTYLPYVGFSESNTWRIVGIYRTEDDIYDVHAVHPNTVYVASDSLAYDYGPPLATDGKNFDLPVTVDERYTLMIPVDAEAAFYAEATVSGFPEQYFAFGDGGYAAQAEAYSELDLAMDEVKEKYRAPLIGALAVALLLTIALLVMLVLSAKEEIERMYAVDSPDSRLFGYLFLRQGVLLLLAGGSTAVLIQLLRAPLSRGWLSLFVDASVAGELLPFLPSHPAWVLYAVLALFLTAAALMAWLGTKRKYHYCYHEEEVETC